VKEAVELGRWIFKSKEPLVNIVSAFLHFPSRSVADFDTDNESGWYTWSVAPLPKILIITATPLF
jgi:hypothetical protein